jgi:hypothetical protein
MKTVNLTTYSTRKKAELIVSDLEAIIKITNQFAEQLVKYRKYIPVREILKEVGSQKLLIRMFHKKYSDVMNENKIS